MALGMTMYIKKATAMHRIAVTFNYQLSIINCQFLVDQVILLAAEARKICSEASAWDRLTYIVTTLGYNLVDINFRSSVAQNISFHNAFKNLMVKLLC